MFNHIKQYKKLFYFVDFLLENNKKVLNNRKHIGFLLNTTSQTRFLSVFHSRSLLVANVNHQLILSRNKSKSRKKTHGYSAEEESSDDEEDSDDDDDDDDDDEQGFERGNEIKTYTVNSLRTDLLLKKLFGISRRKIEEIFYQNKIRLNGELIFKKSQIVQEGDEIDIIKKIEDHCNNTLNVGRIKILKTKFDSDSNKYIMKASKIKSLVIENYNGASSWTEKEDVN